MTLQAENVTAALRAVLGDASTALHEPTLGGREWDYVKDCLDSGWVSSVGQYVDKLEDMLSEYTGAHHATVTVNGTTALQVVLRLAGVRAGDEVIVPALTFVGTANAVAHIGAVPHFADAATETLGIDPAKLDRHLDEIASSVGGTVINKQTGRRIAAVVCVHIFGHAVDLDALTAVCEKHALPLVEDAAESLGSYYKGRHTGNHGLISVLSFNGNKTVTTGGGGAILTNDDTLAKSARHLTTTAKAPHRWEYFHDEVGYNYRMPNINAALGCAQLEQLPGFIERKRALAGLYRDAFADVDGLRFFVEPAFAKSNYWLNAILLDPATAALRDEVLAHTNDNGFMTRPAWTPLHKLPMYAACPRMDLTVAEDLAGRIINIPSSSSLPRPA